MSISFCYLDFVVFWGEGVFFEIFWEGSVSFYRVRLFYSVIEDIFIVRGL